MSRTMKAANLYAPGDIRVEQVPVPVPRKREVLVQVKAVGVCGSDISRLMQTGAHRSPIIPGHELSGEVVELGPHSDPFSQGDRVTVVPMLPCRECDYCEIGEYQLCDDYSYLGSRTDGAYAEYVLAPVENLLRLPDSVSFEVGAMADPMSVALHAVRKANIQPGNRVAVFGVGPIGLFALQWAKTMGASKVFAVDVLPEKLEVARALGADVCIDNRKDDTVEMIKEHTSGRGAECTIEFAGNPTTQQQCIVATSKLGTSVWGGISHTGLELDREAVDTILRNELVIVGSWNSSFAQLKNDWGTSLDFMKQDKIKTTHIITHRFPLESIRQAFEMMLAQREYFNKVMFFPEM